MIGLIYIRKLYDMSMEDVAQKLGITKQTISKWEKQKIPISDKRLRQLSNLFNIPEKYFQGEISDLNKLYIQKIKLNNEMITYKKLHKISEGDIHYDE